MGIDDISEEMDCMEGKQNPWFQPIGKNKERANIACKQSRIGGKCKEGADKIIRDIYSLTVYFKERQYEMSKGGRYEDHKDH